jgi:hypothetical protein
VKGLGKGGVGAVYCYVMSNQCVCVWGGGMGGLLSCDVDSKLDGWRGVIASAVI